MTTSSQWTTNYAVFQCRACFHVSCLRRLTYNTCKHAATFVTCVLHVVAEHEGMFISPQTSIVSCLVSCGFNYLILTTKMCKLHFDTECFYGDKNFGFIIVIFNSSFHFHYLHHCLVKIIFTFCWVWNANRLDSHPFNKRQWQNTFRSQCKGSWF